MSKKNECSSAKSALDFVLSVAASVVEGSPDMSRNAAELSESVLDLVTGGNRNYAEILTALAFAQFRIARAMCASVDANGAADVN